MILADGAAAGAGEHEEADLRSEIVSHVVRDRGNERRVAPNEPLDAGNLDHQPLGEERPAEIRQQGGVAVIDQQGNAIVEDERLIHLDKRHPPPPAVIGANAPHDAVTGDEEVAQIEVDSPAPAKPPEHACGATRSPDRAENVLEGGEILDPSWQQPVATIRGLGAHREAP